MSGVEVVGLIGSTISIVQAITKIYQVIKDRKELPKAFEEVNNKLLLVKNTLELVQNSAKDPSVRTNEVIHFTVRECQGRASALKKIFEDIRDTKDSSSKSIAKRYRSIVLPLG